MGPDERAGVLQLQPEMATLTCGTVNFGDDVFETISDHARHSGEDARVRGQTGVEIFDKGHLSNARRLEKEGLLAFPAHVDFVLGVPGGLDASVQNLADLVDALPPGALVRCGHRPNALPMAMAALAMGGHVRVGLGQHLLFEGPARDKRGARGPRCTFGGELGRPVATPDQRANAWPGKENPRFETNYGGALAPEDTTV